MSAFAKLWLKTLKLKVHGRTWHRQDVIGEMREFRQASTRLHRLSELSDISFTYTRAISNGYHVPNPFVLTSVPSRCVIDAYMIVKYSTRFYFYRFCGWRAGHPTTLREVRNPMKTNKLEEIAKGNRIADVDHFVRICVWWRRYWPFLP
eukprot:gnl/Spiro4/1580_TR837_c0_g1_i1.p1 gnl/Spiro4/1580_TR837_c0_g1~~gnl/Spiro4/1580_TR837_c0_g1_i1.p1  ORF type:complete len:175 (+),score=13.63 gnl/Spiro4/1580_TR837_c0_g1_i1:79-525(+)